MIRIRFCSLLMTTKGFTYEKIILESSTYSTRLLYQVNMKTGKKTRQSGQYLKCMPFNTAVSFANKVHEGVTISTSLPIVVFR